MHSILVIGAGKIGSTIADMLHESGDYSVTVADSSAAALKAVGTPSIKTVQLDFADAVALQAALKGHYAVLSAAPFHLTGHVAKAARLEGVNYFDLTEDVATTRMVKDLAEGATTALIPQCGLAPGLHLHRRRTTSRAGSTSSTPCACGSAPCRTIRRTR